MLGICRDLVHRFRLTKTRSGAGLLHQAIAFKPEKVRPDGVVGEAKRRGEFVDRLRGAAKQADNPAAAGGEKRYVHNESTCRAASPNVMKYLWNNKSNDCLTYFARRAYGSLDPQRSPV